jgi:hypothetical protein
MLEALPVARLPLVRFVLGFAGCLPCELVLEVRGTDLSHRRGGLDFGIVAGEVRVQMVKSISSWDLPLAPISLASAIGTQWSFSFGVSHQHHTNPPSPSGSRTILPFTRDPTHAVQMSADYE